MTPDRSDDEPTDAPESGVRSHLSGSADNVVQARDVRGGVHFHASRETSSLVPRQLPGDPRWFVGRDEALAQLTEILDAHSPKFQVVTIFAITGTAGVGKTCLAVHWAQQVRERFPDGQLYINLRGYDPGLPVTAMQALEQFLTTFGVVGSAVPRDLEARTTMYRSLLAGRRILVVLDNAATVNQVRPLLPGDAGSVVIVTSRNRLSGLMARDGAHRVTLGMLSDTEAIELLRNTTRTYRCHDDPRQLAELAQLCARLPLALRIAAERAASRPLMPLNELIRDLNDESALWDALSAESNEEADAVRTVFAWSYRALSEPTARLFRLLSLHPGPEFGEPAAAALAATTPAKVRLLLDQLVGSHLLEQSGPGRYQFHDLLHAYAIDQRHSGEADDEQQAALRRVLTWYLHTADQAVALTNPTLRRVALEGTTDLVSPPLRFSDYAQASQWYDLEQANLVAANRAAESKGLDIAAWQLPVVLRGFYVHRNPFDVWTTTTNIGLVAARRCGDRYAEADLLESLGQAFRQSHQLDEAVAQHTASLLIRREIGDHRGEAMSANGLGLVLHRERRLEQAVQYFEQSIAMFSELGDAQYAAIASSNLGASLFEQGRGRDAADVLKQAIAVHRADANHVYEVYALARLSRVQRELGALAEGLETAEHGLAIATDLGNLVLEGQMLIDLGSVQLALGRHGEALTSFQQSAAIHRRLADRNREAVAIDCAGQVFQCEGRFDEAVDFHRRAVSVLRDLGNVWLTAAALDHLAGALKSMGDIDQARHAWQESEALVAEYPDARATEMRQRLARTIEELPRGGAAG